MPNSLPPAEDHYGRIDSGPLPLCFQPLTPLGEADDSRMDLTLTAIVVTLALFIALQVIATAAGLS